MSGLDVPEEHRHNWMERVARKPTRFDLRDGLAACKGGRLRLKPNGHIVITRDRGNGRRAEGIARELVRLGLIELVGTDLKITAAGEKQLDEWRPA